MRDFNKRIPVGTPVRYYPVADRSEFIETKTRSDAWALGDGSVVVKIEGRAGGVHIDHVFRLPVNATSGQADRRSS
ncbi:MAG: hypothetical protein IPH13_17890 [Planctomycetes bacterium]|nr:hypothetical protein [Planctomycetota bacterium]MCC7170217.1 hypothetical protein [Planctomycetota bacterium]